MAVRIARHRIITGSGKDRHTINPGERFDTLKHGISTDEMHKMEESGAIRKLRDRDEPAAPVAPPVVEDRSGPVADAVSTDAHPAARSGTPAAKLEAATAKPAGRTSKSDDDDL